MPPVTQSPVGWVRGRVHLELGKVADLRQQRSTAVTEYLAACREKGILQVRIIHGKGIGHLRRGVHALLERHPDVISFALGGEGLGGWGATVVNLAPPLGIGAASE